MTGADPEAHAPVQEYGVGRVEALSDGVIAVAITLLVLDLRVPEPSAGRSLADQLGDMWPNYLAYVISFLAIGIIRSSSHQWCFSHSNTSSWCVGRTCCAIR